MNKEIIIETNPDNFNVIAIAKINKDRPRGPLTVSFPNETICFSKEDIKNQLELLIKVDSYLSLLRHRGNIKWGVTGMCENYEVDKVIGKLREEIEKIKSLTKK